MDHDDKLHANTSEEPPTWPVLLFRRRLKSVADVLKGIRNHGFTQQKRES